VSSTTAGLSGFSAWIGNYPGLADTAPLGNPAQDGIPNLLKYVLNGNPGLASTAILPRVSKLASSSIFTFSRRAESAQDTTQIFQYSTDLSHWTNVMITSPTDAKVALGAADANGVQIVTVTIPAGNNASLFGRLSVTDSVPYASGFSAWIANYPSLTGPNALSTANPTHDGLTNLVKYALGLDPTVAHGDLGTLSGKTLSFTKGTIASGDSNVSYTIQESTDMVTWATATRGLVSNIGGSITYTFPSTRPSKLFIRLQVTQFP